MRSVPLCAAVVLVSLAAGAKNSISDELSVGTVQSTPGNPRAGSVSDALNASFDLTDRLSLLAGAELTSEGRTAAANRGGFPTSGSAIAQLSLGVDWDVNDHVSTGLLADLSPRSSQQAGTQLNVTNANGTSSELNARLLSQSSNGSLTFDLSYDTAGESDLEWTFSGSLTAGHYSTTQDVDMVRFTVGGAGMTKAQLIAYCNAHPTGKGSCSTALRQVLKAQGAQLDSLKTSLEAMATIRTDTDVSMSLDYYAYQQDPASVGIFSVGASGRQTISGGNGVPIAPLRFLVRPEVTHRFGQLAVKLWAQAGEYVSGTAQSTTGLGARVQYKFTKEFRMWISAAGENDVDSQGNGSPSGTFALGAGYRF